MVAASKCLHFYWAGEKLLPPKGYILNPWGHVCDLSS